MRIKLKVFRVKHNLTQRGIATRLGYKRAYYGHIERGFMAGSDEFWQRLQEAFALTESEVQELKDGD